MKQNHFVELYEYNKGMDDGFPLPDSFQDSLKEAGFSSLKIRRGRAGDPVMFFGYEGLTGYIAFKGGPVEYECYGLQLVVVAKGPLTPAQTDAVTNLTAALPDFEKVNSKRDLERLIRDDNLM